MQKTCLGGKIRVFFQQCFPIFRTITEMFEFLEKNQDQIRETINSGQRFAAFLEARRRADAYRGSMAFVQRGSTEYLLKDYYDPANGVRRQTSIGKRSVETEALLADFQTGREAARERLAAASSVLERQAGINRALGLGRVPEIGARILRALDAANLLGRGLKVVGTHALFAYEAEAGVFFPSELMTTEDIDVLMDARANIRLLADDPSVERSLIGLLRKADRSFAKTRQPHQAANRDGYLVDLIKPLRNPPWAEEAGGISADTDDLQASEIEGLLWHENAPVFEAVAIDARGFPLRIVAPDPSAFAVHKLWLSTRPDRRADKRSRDRMQAEMVARMVADHMPHRPFDGERLKSFPKKVVEAAAALFTPSANRSGFSF